MGKHRDKHFETWTLLWIIFIVAFTVHVEGATVTLVQPQSGSLAGGSRITVEGTGFAGDQFTQNNDPNVGNKVYLVDTGERTDTYSCETHIDGTTSNKIECYTPKGLNDRDYYVKVYVNGVKVPDSNLCNGNPLSNNCKYRPTASQTPTITSFTPNTGVPMDFVRFEGQIFTDRYGSNIDSSSNGKSQKLLRVYVGAQDCEMKNGDDPWDLSLDSSSSDNGHIVCLTKGKSLGFFNVSYLVEYPYGRSLPDPSEYLVSYKDDIYLYQVYTNITSLSPTTGSTAGGTILTIYGHYFDQRPPYAAAKVYIDDTVCEVTKVELDQYIECRVAAQPSQSKTYYRGNRGALLEIWNGTTKTSSTMDEILDLTNSNSGYTSSVIDEIHYTNSATDYVSRVTFFYQPPHTGQYAFQLKGKDGARLFVNGVSTVTSSSSLATSARMNLDSSTLYRLQIVHYQGSSGDSEILLKAKYFNTTFTTAWLGTGGKVDQEMQTIGISSTIVHEQQELVFSNFAARAASNEIQTVVITTEGSSFRFGLYGVFTEPIDREAYDTTVQTAFNALPIFETGESVTVTRTSSSTPTFIFNITSNRGDWPNIEVRGIQNGASATASVSETQGVPDMNTVSLLWEQRVSSPFRVSDLSVSKLTTVAGDMLKAKCPAVFESQATKSIYYDYETASPSKGKFGGWRVRDTEPFCNSYSLKNPWSMYELNGTEVGIGLQSHGKVCFAYKGVFQDYLYARFSYLSDGERGQRTRSFAHTFMKDSDTVSTTWYYTCHDMMSSVTAAAPSGSSDLRLERVWVGRATGEDIFVDSLYIGSTEPLSANDYSEAALRRLAPAMPNGAIIDSVSVAETSGGYRLTFVPYDCGNAFPMIVLGNGDKKSGSLASTSDAVTYGLSNEGSGNGRLAVTRTASASPPVTGTITVTYNGQSKSNLNVSLEADDFRKELEGVAYIGSLSVVKTGNCAQFNYAATFMSSGGDLPEMSVDFSQLSGIGVTGSITTNTDGALYYAPITGDMISTVHSTPQLRALINNVHTACAGDCSYQWSSSATPTVTNVSPATGTLSTRIVITGTLFDATPSNNNVTIGGVACAVNASTTTTITCDAGNGPHGAHKVMVNVKDKGDADHGASNKTFTYTWSVNGISPNSGSLGGGLLLTVTGYGFQSGVEVTINSKQCTVTGPVQPDSLTCIVPQSSTAASYDVSVVQGSVTKTYSSFTYSSSLTAVVSGIASSSIPVSGTNVTISGSSFGSTQRTVMLGSQLVTIVSWTDSQIVIATGVVSAGNQDVKIDTGNGYAVDGSNALPSISAQLDVTNVYPLVGSLQGGTNLTITGTGFGTDAALIDVDVGNFDCVVSEVSNTEISCQISNIGQAHQITNNGIDRAFGQYYAYDIPNIQIRKGEWIQWSWTTPEFVNDVVHAVVQVESLSSTTAMSGGFSSGTATRSGTYTYQFNEVGIYYVWSGFNDIWSIKNYYGTINVTDFASSLGVVKVKRSGIEAMYDVGGSANPTDSSSCGATVSSKSGCTDSQPTGGESGKFNFVFWSCNTPIASAIDTNNGTTSTRITISGEGFSTSKCQNEVMFGNAVCSVTSSTASSIECNIAKIGEPDIGVLHPVSVRVGNRGNALVSIMSQASRSFALLPNIESISPESGSRAGGALLTLSGFGLSNSPYVAVNGYQCSIVSSNYTTIICETPSSSSQQTVIVNATVRVGASQQDVSCETRCQYAYLTLQTPSINSITPTSTTGSIEFSITGSGLGTSTAEVEVTIGGETATVSSVTPTVLNGTIANLPVGNNPVIVKVKNYGKASGNVNVASTAVVSGVTPSSGSIHGDTLVTISGNGFVNGQTTVSIGGSQCAVSSVTLAQVVCLTSARATGTVSVAVTSNGVSFPTVSFDYTTASTPNVISVSPSSGLSGSILNITGENLDGDDVTVTLNNSACTVTSKSSSLIRCTLGNHKTGTVPVKVLVSNLGVSNTNIEFEYELSLTGITPSTGGIAGGQTVTMQGTGFDSSLTGTICDQACTLVSFTTTQFVCKTPANTAQTCNVSLTVNSLTKSLSAVYVYDGSITPSVSSVSPTRGGTGGGTPITISGSGFGNSLGAVSVTIDGSSCVPSSVIPTEIQCVTGSHAGSISTNVEVEIGGNGIAQEASPGSSSFEYIDVWSSPFTWGGGPLPQAGEFVVIPKGQHLVLDTDTPILKFLLIQGGQLYFDEKDVTLNAEVIMITDGGLLQVGTEANPFQHKAIIVLHGHHRSKELPIYGTKVLAVRNGTLDLHGIKTPTMWTRLSSTAAAGSSTLNLQLPVEWKVGDEIVIASTGNRHSQKENEKHTISAISNNNMTLTLRSPLEYQHFGTEETFNGTLVEFRAEVGLLSHNVVVQGNADPQWEDEIEACEAGFDTGEFATQTCFLGRFGDEIGSSQFGGMILVHSPVRDAQEAIARLSYIEVTFAGQAFRLGRYPIHFHLNGEMSNSYVRGVSIHHTFNRAVNIHGSHNTIVENTVIYNIMGGAFFLEDGIETGNTFQYNLAVFVRESSSLLNDDVTPASFWVTNPNNTIRHNAAAGGSHFGYWYRMHDHPDGPSATDTICPKLIPLGEFNNNSAHSFGWFGLWTFPDYFPKVGGRCGESTAQPVVFNKLTSWNNEKGAEVVNGGTIQFHDFVGVQNQKAGLENKKIIGSPRYTNESAMIKNSLIVARTTVIPDSLQGCTTAGIVHGYGFGYVVDGVRFINFDGTCAGMSFASIDGTCTTYCGGYTYHTRNLTFVDSPNRLKNRWEWNAVMVDRDGSLTNKSEADWKVVPTSGTLPRSCHNASDAYEVIGVPTSFCPPDVVFHRYSFNNPSPFSLEGKDFVFTNQYGSSSVPFRKKGISHPFGWMLALVSGEEYKFEFRNAEHMTNMSWTGDLGEFESDDYIIVKVKSTDLPDRLSVDGGKNFINATVGNLDPATQRYGDWTWDTATNEINLLVHGTARSKRDVSFSNFDPSFSFKSFKCFYDNCIPPPDPNTIPPKVRPLDFHYWDDSALWNDTGDGYITNDPGRNSSYGDPQHLDNIKILYDSWIIINTTAIPNLGTVLLEGVLELMDTSGHNYVLNVDFIIIRGGRLVIGTPDNPFQAAASIIVRGNHSTPVWSDGGDGPAVGSKAIAVFGGLDLHGKDKGITWTKLATTANAGTNQITLLEAVGWEPMDDIVIGPTSYNVWETESFRIKSISPDNKTLTLNDTLRYKKLAHSETIGGRVLQLGASVGLLSHNVKVIGEDYPNMYTESCGARIVVGLLVLNGQYYTGYARVSNVEFYHTGQEGYIEEYDPRFSLAYVATGSVSDVKPSYVSKASFHNGFNTAVGAFGIGGLNITDCVVFGSIGHALRTSSDDTRLINNMVALVVWRGSYQDRYEPFNFFQDSGIEAVDAKRLILKDNHVSGSERFGFHVPPQACDDTSDNYTNNVAQGNVIGVGILPNDAFPTGNCLKYQNFITWRNLDFGIYYQGGVSFVGDNNTVIENGNGYHTHVFGPSPLSHNTSDKTIEIRNSLVVGALSSFDCAADYITDDTETDNLKLRLSTAKLASNGGKIGITFGNFMGGSNSAPIKPWSGIITYPAISGLTKIKNTTFAYFNDNSCSRGDFAVATSGGNDDGQHPVEVEQISFSNVNENFKVSYHRPNVGKINSADCVDMDCDGLKKCLLKDTDGSFLGSPGSVIPQSEFEWNGDPRRGLGDYRIPKEMVTEMNGTRISYNDFAPLKGIIRSPNCSFVTGWTAYRCFGYNYEMLIIESMDSDTETRRLSPVAIAGPMNETRRFVDLINGPQDHGWCSGYTCRKRVSTFMAVVATGFHYLVHFTSTTPEHLRFHLLNVEADQGIKLTVWYSRPNRLDVFSSNNFVIASNARIDSNGNYIISMPQDDEFDPGLDNTTGTNYCDRDRGEITFIIKGPGVIDIVTKPTIIVSFSLPALTVEQFFGPNLIENLAAFLDVPATKVRIVNVVNAQSGSRRRRSTGGVIVTAEVSDPPSATLNETATDPLTQENLAEKATMLVNECQAGNVSSSLNVSACENVMVPSPSAGEDGVTYTTPSVSQLVFHASPAALYEGKLLAIQPKIQAVDISNVVITQLGTNDHPWQLSVEIRTGTGHSNAVLSGTKTVNATNGWFNFTDLVISHMGNDYTLDFNVIYPTNAVNFTLASQGFNVPGRPLKAYMKSITAGDKFSGTPFAATFDLRDDITSEIISDITWRSHTWQATATILGSPRYGGLGGTLSTSFDVLTGEAEFTNLNLTGAGVYYIKFTAVSTPPDYSLVSYQKIVLKKPGIIAEKTIEVKWRFDVSFSTVLNSTEAELGFDQYIGGEIANRFGNVQVESTSVTQGSIVVTFVLSGNTTDINATAYSLCDSVLNSTSYAYNGYTLTLSPFMTVDNQQYYGVTCGAVSNDDDDDDTLSTAAIIGIAFGGAIVLLLLVVIGILLWKKKIIPNTKTHDTTGHYTSNTGMNESFFKQDSFIPMKGAKALPPAGTLMSQKGPERRPASGMSSISVHVRSPEPTNPNAKKESWNGHMFNRPGSVTMPPSYLESEATYIDPNDRAGNKQLLRSPSPAMSSSSSKVDGRVTPFEDRDSPMPPVGHDLYNTEYLVSPIPRSTTPHLPAPSPKPKPKHF